MADEVEMTAAERTARIYRRIVAAADIRELAPSLAELAAALGISRQAAARLVRKLVASGRLEFQGGMGNWSAYRIVATGKTTAGWLRAPKKPVPVALCAPVPLKSSEGTMPMADETDLTPRQKYRRRYEQHVFGRKPERQRTKRSCLTCGAIFMSDGPHHRLCKNHRHADDGVRIYSLAV